MEWNSKWNFAWQIHKTLLTFFSFCHLCRWLDHNVSSTFWIHKQNSSYYYYSSTILQQMQQLLKRNVMMNSVTLKLWLNCISLHYIHTPPPDNGIGPRMCKKWQTCRNQSHICTQIKLSKFKIKDDEKQLYFHMSVLQALPLPLGQQINVNWLHLTGVY